MWGNAIVRKNTLKFDFFVFILLYKSQLPRNIIFITIIQTTNIVLTLEISLQFQLKRESSENQKSPFLFLLQNEKRE